MTVHLTEAGARGAGRTVLCATSDIAARADRAVGLRRSGITAMILMAGPLKVGA